MQTQPAPWNLNNSNVMILAGPWYELIAIKYGLCITDNRQKLLPCKYIAIYENDTIKHLFEVNSIPLDNASVTNSNEIRNVKDNDPNIFKEWYGDKELCRLFHLNKDADVGPIVNDYISTTTNRLAPLTRGTPRYTTYQKVLGAKLTSHLECVYDDEELPYEPIVEVEKEPEPEQKKINFFPWLVGFIILVAIGVAYIFINKNSDIPVKELAKEEQIAPVVPEIPPLEGDNFEQGSAKLKPTTEPILRNILKIIESQYPTARLYIIGHTDNRGSEESNKKLSDERALAVRKWFIDNGFAADKISHKGVGSSEPLANNNSEEGRARNRRTEIKIITE